jgi:plastocyanin
VAQLTVRIQKMAFQGDPAKIKAGDTIVWQNQDRMTHTATADDGSFDTGNIAAGSTSKPITFNKAGDVPYHCEIHPSMTGAVQVS